MDWLECKWGRSKSLQGARGKQSPGITVATASGIFIFLLKYFVRNYFSVTYPGIEYNMLHAFLRKTSVFEAWTGRGGTFVGTALVSFAALYPPLLRWKCLQILDHPPSSIYLKVVRTPIFICHESCPDAESLQLVSVHSLDEKSGRNVLKQKLGKVRSPGAEF